MAWVKLVMPAHLRTVVSEDFHSQLLAEIVKNPPSIIEGNHYWKVVEYSNKYFTIAKSVDIID